MIYPWLDIHIYSLHRSVNYEPMLQEQATTCGALDGGSPCRLSILRITNVACLCCLFMPMSHVEFKK